MTRAGWYPDPAGQPQTFRYWDGSAWSQVTTSNPYAPPPVPPVPPGPPAAPYGPTGGYAAAPRRSGLTILLVVVAVLAFAGLGVGGFVGYRVLADDDDAGAAAGERTSATDPVTTAPTEVSSPTGPTSATGGPTDQQCHGGVPTPSVTPRRNAERVSGGSLSIPVPPGYAPEVAYASAFTWADGFTPLQKTIEQVDQYGWVSIYGVGGLRRANGFDDPAQAAEVVMACMAASPDLYSHFSGREDLASGEITVDGADAYQLTSELRVDDPQISVEGDVAQVIVVDSGDPDSYGVYITVVPIGDQRLLRQQQQFADQITVD